MNKKVNLQLFAAPDKMTGNAQIQVKAREIDFVTSFGKNIQSLLDILGITRMIKKPNGSVLKIKRASGVLEDGYVGEGEEIPYSQFKVIEETFDTIKCEKFRKGVSLEAIEEKGYEAAVEMTDEEMKTLLQNKVEAKFYDQLNKGSLVGNGATFQKAVSKAIGSVKAKFKEMGRTATGVAVFVNINDVYDYLGEAQITTQTAFGMDYIQNFLGANIVFLTTKVKPNTVVATPLNNLIAYYVDPADSEFARAGLTFTTDAQTGFIGVHTEGNYGRMMTELFAIMGVRLFAEYMDAIAHVAIGDAPTQTLGKLTLTSEEGELEGTTKLVVKEQLNSINDVFKYKEAATATTVTYGMDVKNWTRWDGESEIVAKNGNHITMVECDASFKAIASGDVVVVAKQATQGE